MLKIIHFFVGQRLFINLLVTLIFLMGGYILYNTNREAFPNVNFDMVSITTLYPGASPDEIEQLITIPVEKKLRVVNGLDRVRAYNIENVSVLVVYIDPDAAGKKKIVDDVKDAVDSVTNLPAGAHTPVVDEITLDTSPVMDIALASSEEGDEAYRELRNVILELEDRLYELDGVAEIERFGYREREYLVEVDPRKLMALRMGINSVSSKLGSRNFNLPGGVLRIKGQEYLLRTLGQFRKTSEIGQTVIDANFSGFDTRIRDIARVSDTFEEVKIHERFNGQNSIILKVWKKQDADILDLTDRIKESVAAFHPQAKRKITISHFNDYSRFVRRRLRSLIINGVIGFILLAAILVLLLGPRISAIVGVSIPLAFMVAFMGMRLAGITLNIISMFALVMVLGMIVDFSIVVAENSYRHMENGWNALRAVEQGTAEIFWPVTTTLLCITAAFFPLLFMTGIIGKFVLGIPLVIMICLGASWFAAMFVLPNHLETFARVRRQKRKRKEEDGFFHKLQGLYRRLLALVLRRRYLTLLVLILVFFLSLIISGLWLGFVFFPGGGAEGILVRTKMPQGTTLEVNLQAIKQLEKIIARLPAEEMESMHSRVGVELSSFIDPAPGEGTHRGTVIINLTPVGSREREAEDILDQLRQDTKRAIAEKKLSDKLKLDFRVQAGGPPVGLPVNVEIRGRNIPTLKKIAGEYMDFLKTLPGVYDISIDLEEGKEEFRFRVSEDRASRANISVRDAALAVRTAFDGNVATTVNEGEDEIDVRVRFADRFRETMKGLKYVFVANQSGGLVPLDEITSYDVKPGYSQINRLNFRRVIQVQANVNTAITTSLAVNRRLTKKFANLKERYPDYTVNYGGEEEDRRESMANLMILFAFALFGIFIILATFFRSLILPGVVMSAIPFGLVGVVFALAVHFKPLSFMSVLGVVSLAGVVVSNTLVLVQFINNLRQEGYALREALIEGGAMRLRPVILTSATTVLGLVPTVYGIGGRDDFVAPLALAFGYGLIFATFITLILIPCFYHIAEDFKHLLSRLLNRIGIEMEGALYRMRS